MILPRVENRRVGARRGGAHRGESRSCQTDASDTRTRRHRPRGRPRRSARLIASARIARDRTATPITPHLNGLPIVIGPGGSGCWRP